jgi:aspartate-semialdehyde dehydrogenase
MEKKDVAILGASGATAFGWVAQTIAKRIYDGHPYFRLAALIADNPEHNGKPFKECIKRWYVEEDFPEGLANMSMVAPDPKALEKAGEVKLVISALPPWLSTDLDPIFPKAGIPVVSESPGFRFDDDVPLVVPEINADHLSIIEDQKKRRGWKSFIVSNPVCTITVITLSMKPILDAFGIKTCFIVTLQALSGAGWDGIPSLAIIDNVIPFIMKEEEKLEKEGPKILGTKKGGKIVTHPMGISTSCNRVGVMHGHTACIFVDTERPASLEEAKEAFVTFQGTAQEIKLPSAPEHPIIYLPQEDRPQPRLDRNLHGGMAVAVGRIRKDPVFKNGIKWVVSGHNNVRGTYKNTLLNAELLYKQGLL